MAKVIQLPVKVNSYMNPLDKYDSSVARFEQYPSLENLHEACCDLLEMVPFVKLQIPRYKLVQRKDCEYLGIENPDAHSLDIIESGLTEHFEGLARNLADDSSSFKNDLRAYCCYLSLSAGYLERILDISLRSSRFASRFHEITEDLYKRCSTQEQERHEELQERAIPLKKQIARQLERASRRLYRVQDEE